MSILETLSERGLVQQKTEGLSELLSQDAQTFYVGFDPTAAALHVGHLVPIMVMMHLQRAGHRPIALVGGATAMVGDPSGKDEARKLLSAEQIEDNKRALKSSLQRFLDFGPGGAIMVDNADWLLPWRYIDFLREVGRHVSVNQMLSKASVKLRLERGLSFLEFNYQLLQAYDFVELQRRYGCRLQVGGDDQWGNITAGMDLIRRLDAVPAEGMTTPLLTTSSGQKMGKTAAGAVWLDPEFRSHPDAELVTPFRYYQYWVQTQDLDVSRFLRIFTFLPIDEIQRLEQLQGADIRAAKEVLALEATAVVHGRAAAEAARDASRELFYARSSSASIPAHHTPLPIGIVDLLKASGLCSSNSDARRQLKQGSVYLGTQRDKLQDETRQITLADLVEDGGLTLWKGKKNARRILAEK